MGKGSDGEGSVAKGHGSMHHLSWVHISVLAANQCSFFKGPVDRCKMTTPSSLSLITNKKNLLTKYKTIMFCGCRMWFSGRHLH